MRSTSNKFGNSGHILRKILKYTGIFFSLLFVIFILVVGYLFYFELCNPAESFFAARSAFNQLLGIANSIENFEGFALVAEEYQKKSLDCDWGWIAGTRSPSISRTYRLLGDHDRFTVLSHYVDQYNSLGLNHDAIQILESNDSYTRHALENHPAMKEAYPHGNFDLIPKSYNFSGHVEKDSRDVELRFEMEHTPGDPPLSEVKMYFESCPITAGILC